MRDDGLKCGGKMSFWKLLQEINDRDVKGEGKKDLWKGSYDFDEVGYSEFGRLKGFRYGQGS